VDAVLLPTSGRAARAALLVLALLGACRSPAPATPSPAATAAATAGSSIPARRRPDGVELASPSAHVRATVTAADVVRVQAWPIGAAVPELSFAVEEAARGAAPFTVDEDAQSVTVHAGALALRIDRQTLAVSLRAPDGTPILEQLGPVVWAPSGEGGTIAFRLDPRDHAYGLGDKAKGLDRRGQRFDLWNYDAFGWGGDTDPLYKSIPFLVLLREGRAHGLFVDNAARAHVDVGAADPGRLAWEVERGAFDLTLFAGPDPRRVVAAYTALTGRMPLPPRWALGYHQSRYSYASEAEVRALVDRFRADRIPLDVVWLDIDYQDGLAPFTVDRRRFPRFEAMVADLRAAGVRTVAITDPHIKVTPGLEPYASGRAGDHFILGADGKPFTGEVWPGLCVFPEFTLSRTRAWWGGLYGTFVADGLAGFWNDMNEPALFNVRKSMPEEVRHRLEDGGTADHVAIHNVYGLLNARATFEGLLALRPGARPFVLTRAGFAGAQKYAATWTGDNVASRAGLALTIPTLANLGASGWAFAGADVGGFAKCPDPALLSDWMELGAYQPFFRNHSAKETCRREPWVNGPEHERRRRAAIEQRERLVPYLYTVFEEASRTGLPVLRALWLEYPDDPSTWANDRAFLLGRDLLVAPRLADGEGPWSVTLPRGGWFDTATGAALEGGRTEVAPRAGESVRVFARAGAIVPEGPVVQHADDRPDGPLTLDVWPGADCQGALYLDAGDGFGYRGGELRRVRFRCEARPDGIAVSARSEGTFPTWWTATQVVVHGVPRAPRLARGPAGATAPVRDPAAASATVALPGAGADWAIELSW
jgi:alpha-glucosidase